MTRTIRRAITDYRAEHAALGLPSVGQEIAVFPLGGLAFASLALLAFALVGGGV